MGGLSWVAVGAAAGIGVVWSVCAAAAAQPPAGDLVQVRLVSESTELIAGRENWLALDFTIKPHWHLYWDGRNDSGMPPSVEWTLPDGFTAGALHWPAPKRLVQPGGLLDHVYEDRLTLLVPLTVPASASPGSVRIAGQLNWMVCSDVCLLGQDGVSIELPVGSDAGRSPKPGPDSGLFRSARERLPKALPKPMPRDGGPIRATWKPGEVELVVPGAERVAFHAGTECSPLVDLIADGEAKGDRLRIRLNTVHDGPVRLVGILEGTLPKPAPPSIVALDLSPATTPGAGGNCGG